MTNFATYPDGIFKGIVKVMLLTIIPVGLSIYIPVHVITQFDLLSVILVVSVAIFLLILSFIIFNRGLKRYSSSNLMIARM